MRFPLVIFYKGRLSYESNRNMTIMKFKSEIYTNTNGFHSKRLKRDTITISFDNKS